MDRIWKLGHAERCDLGYCNTWDSKTNSILRQSRGRRKTNANICGEGCSDKPNGDIHWQLLVFLTSVWCSSLAQFVLFVLPRHFHLRLFYFLSLSSRFSSTSILAPLILCLLLLPTYFHKLFPRTKVGSFLFTAPMWTPVYVIDACPSWTFPASLADQNSSLC